MASEQDVDTLVMENELIKRDMKDMEDRVKAEIAGALQASREETKAQIAGLMDFLAKGQLAQGQGNGQNNNGNGAAEMSGLEEKQASAATPARQNLNFIYGAKNTQTPAANASRADSQPSSGNGGNAGWRRSHWRGRRYTMT